MDFDYLDFELALERSYYHYQHNKKEQNYKEKRIKSKK